MRPSRATATSRLETGSLDDHIPRDHLLRGIDRLLDLSELPAPGGFLQGHRREEEIDAYRERSRAQAMDQFEVLLRQIEVGARVRASVRQGDARLELLGAADEDGSDLIAVGKQGQSLLADTLLGSVTSWLLN